jgi:hypothetical protein
MYLLYNNNIKNVNIQKKKKFKQFGLLQIQYQFEILYGKLKFGKRINKKFYLILLLINS